MSSLAYLLAGIAEKLAEASFDFGLLDPHQSNEHCKTPLDIQPHDLDVSNADEVVDQIQILRNEYDEECNIPNYDLALQVSVRPLLQKSEHDEWHQYYGDHHKDDKDDVVDCIEQTLREPQKELEVEEHNPEETRGDHDHVVNIVALLLWVERVRHDQVEVDVKYRINQVVKCI